LVEGQRAKRQGREDEDAVGLGDAGAGGVHDAGADVPVVVRDGRRPRDGDVVAAQRRTQARRQAGGNHAGQRGGGGVGRGGGGGGGGGGEGGGVGEIHRPVRGRRRAKGRRQIDHKVEHGGAGVEGRVADGHRHVVVHAGGRRRAGEDDVRAADGRGEARGHV